MQMGRDNILDEILEEVRSSRNELKNTILASESRLLLKIESLKQRITRLEEENADLKGKVELLERVTRKNNVVIFGLTCNEISVASACNEINKHLGIEISEADINDVLRLGNHENSPVKVEFNSYQKKKLVLENKKKLRETKVYIGNDLTKLQQAEQRILKKHLLIKRQDRSISSFIKGNKLYVDGKPHTAKELEGEIDNVRQSSNSAPSTPAPSKADFLASYVECEEATSIDATQEASNAQQNLTPSNTTGKKTGTILDAHKSNLLAGLAKETGPNATEILKNKPGTRAAVTALVTRK